MKKQYRILGMTCGGCVASVKKALEGIKGVQAANIQLAAPEGTLTLDQNIPILQLQSVLAATGSYTISEIPAIPVEETHVDLPNKSITTYKPLLLIIGFIAGVSLLAQYPIDDFSGMLWMRHFMAGFFIVFSFFKLLNIEGFATSFQMYDIISARWKGWGYIYPFVELSLGLLYLLDIAPFATNIATVIVLGIGSIGVIKSNLNKQKIKCACLGDVFNLPMSTVTIVEDLTMVAMASFMLFL